MPLGMLAGGGMPGPALETQAAAAVASALVGSGTTPDTTMRTAKVKRLTTAGTVALTVGYAPGLR
jgi:hypothetical protein